ncbi:MAG: hypothetical protein FWG64_09125 [Firmicutes bacterium]|nr:hypothetical protein [Bacillota bacterium]
MSKEELQQITDHIRTTLKAEESKLIKARHNKKRANIRLLLSKYRDITRHAKNTEYESSQMPSDTAIKELLEMIETAEYKFRIESLFDSVIKTQALINHMDKMLAIYKQTCEISDKPETMRQYRIIHALYIADKPKPTIEELAQQEFISPPTVYRDIDTACENLAVLFFGVFGLQFL